MRDYTLLIESAKEAQGNSYAPYSNYNVGAALLCENGKIYKGCNVENASYGATICAERVAIASAISAGERKFVAIAIVGGEHMSSEAPAFPCGICRQALSELCDDDFDIVLCSDDKTKIYKLDKLFPNGFKL